MPASMPTRHGGRFTNRAAIRAREIFSRRTIAPLSSRPIICSVFLPVSIPMVRATAVSALLGMACPPRALQAPNRLCVSLAAGARPVHPIRDARLSDLETELEQLAMDARRTPQRIVNAHPPDQRAQVHVDLRSTSKRARFPTPVPTEADPMPTYEGLGPDDRDCLEDRWEPSIQHDQEQAMPIRELDATAHPPPQHNQLMPECRVLCLKSALRLERRGEHGQEEAEQRNHHR